MARKDDKRGPREPLFTISAVAELLDLHQQTLRKYEEEGFVTPLRSPGGTRMYSRDDVETLRVVITLTRELGVNLAGAEVVLRLRSQLLEARKLLQFVLENLEETQRERILALMRGDQHGIVPAAVRGAGLVPQSILEMITGEDE